MTDRISTQVLPNGAIRYAEYDSSGNFVQYRYLLPADDPLDAGTPINKSTMLADETALAFGLHGTDATVNNALRKGANSVDAWTRFISNIGDFDIGFAIGG